MLLDRNLHRASGCARSGAWPHLLSALQVLCGYHAVLIGHHERAWASATFCGARHRVILSFTGDAAAGAAETLIACLPEHEFTIPQQIVADAQVLAVDHTLLPAPKVIVELELLLLEDA